MAQEVRRPPITGFSHVAFSSSSPVAAKQFYAGLLGWSLASDRDFTSSVAKASRPKPRNRRIRPRFFPTSPLPRPMPKAWRRYLEARGVQVPAKTNHESNGTRWFALGDPEAPIIVRAESRTAED